MRGTGNSWPPTRCSITTGNKFAAWTFRRPFSGRFSAPTPSTGFPVCRLSVLHRVQSALIHERHDDLVNPGFVLARGHILVQPPVLGVLGGFAGLQDAQGTQGFQFEKAGLGVSFEIAAKIGISFSRFDRSPLHEEMAVAEIRRPAGRVVDAEHLLAKAREG